MTSILNQYIDIDAFADPIIREKSTWESEKEAIEAMKGNGMVETPGSMVFDGRIHRFGKDGDCWYSATLLSNVPVVHFGDWHDTSTWGTFRGSYYQELSEAKRREIDEMQRIQRDAAEKELEKVRAEAAERSVACWEQAKPADPRTNVYLDAKGLKDAYGTRVDDRGCLLVPLYSPEGAIVSLERIKAPGKDGKKYMPGSRTKGCLWWIGDPMSQAVYLTEGFATGASVHEATGKTVYISFSAGNLSSVAKTLTSWGRAVMIIADNDASGTGEREASKAAKLTGCQWWMVPNHGDPGITDANDYQTKVGDLADIIPSLDGSASKLHVLMASDLVGKPRPIRWLLKGWIPQRSVGMVFGPSGGGKTNFIMDIACTLATASLDRENPTRWADGRRCHRANTVYLCGEGFDGLIGRLNAWMKMNDKGDVGNLAIINHPLNLDEAPAVESVIAAIQGCRKLDHVDMIIIDTVNRYMSGDENSAQDTRAFMNSVVRLQETFDCTILYVHHTGKNENVDDPRGSSAFTGAMDFSISVSKDKLSGLRVAKPVKMKDGELREQIYGDIVGVRLGDEWDDPDEPDEPYTAPVWQYVSEDQTPQPNRGKWDNEIIDAFASKGQWMQERGKFLIQMDDWRNYLKESMGMGTKPASDYLRGKTGPIKDAMKRKALEPTSTGWWLHDKWMQEQVIMRKTSGTDSEKVGD